MNWAADAALSSQQSALLPCQLVAAAKMAILHVSLYSSLRCELAHPDNAVEMLVMIGMDLFHYSYVYSLFFTRWTAGEIQKEENLFVNTIEKNERINQFLNFIHVHFKIAAE